jgi:hypothetical protein
LYSSPNIIRQIKSRIIRWVGHVTCIREERKVFKVLVGNPRGKRPLGSSRCKWDDRIKTDLREIGWRGVEWIHLTQDRYPVAGSCKYGDEPSDCGTTELVTQSVK